MMQSMTQQELRLTREVEAIGRVEPIQRLLEVACRLSKTGFACVARVTPERWIAGAVFDEIQLGVEAGGEIPIDATLCDGVRRNNKLVVLDDVSKDSTFCDHPTLVQMGIQCYISVPVVLPNGAFFGTLCALDRFPNRLSSPEVVGMFGLFAELIAQHLDSQVRLEQSEQALLTERESSVLREEFIAVLGHDLRNPLSAIHVSAVELTEEEYGEEVNEIGEVIRDCAGRMNSMIADVLDLARGRLGGGVGISATEHDDLSGAIEHVIDELEVAHPDREIQRDICLGMPVRADLSRLSQLISNLIANAIHHGAKDKPVRVRACVSDGSLLIEVANHGEKIPAEVARQLFQPFRRAAVNAHQDGLGLGLYIASEIAKAHGGTLRMKQRDGEIRFEFRMPVDGNEG